MQNITIKILKRRLGQRQDFKYMIEIMFATFNIS